MILDWNSIRPLNGGRDKGFEELCAQLARAESPPGSEFVRKGTPDAGVECYAVLHDKSEWGWQAKYFDALGDTQWPQLDDSVKTAIEKHPKLVRYFICLPLDRPDARIDGRKSAKERWDDHVKKWTKWTSDKGMTVEFVYWGSHELLERLARPEHIGRVRFWFGVRGFDGAWFSARLDEALRTAGPRYTPEIHIDLPIVGEFEAFGRTARFFDQMKSHARKIREKLQTVEYREQRIADPILDPSATTLSARIQTILAGFGAIEPQPIGALTFKKIAEHIREAEAVAKEYAQLLAEREREYEAKSAVATDSHTAPPSYRSNPFRDRRFRLLDLSSILRNAREALEHAEDIAGASVMILRGVAGTGKTHLLCDVARHRVAAGHPTVLLMGQRFVSTDAPWSQALQQLDMADISAEEFVGALESAAQVTGSRALLIIDALNEGAGRSIWPSHLPAFLLQIQRSLWIGVVLAVRSSYEEIVIPEEVRVRTITVTHEGFRDHEYDATKTFFVHYGLELPSTPLLAPEFRNPLFLKTLCQGLHTQGERRLPRGFHGITAVFNLYLNAINKRLALALGFDARIPLVRQALEVMTKALLDAGKHSLTLVKAGEIVNALLPNREFERSLYRGLVVEGVLVEEAPASPSYGLKHEEEVFVAYERFADHLTAKILLDMHLDIRNPTSAFEAEKPLAFISSRKSYVSPGLLEAMCIQIPERIRQELISIAPSCVDHGGIAEAFRQSIIWRSYDAFSKDTADILDKLCRNEYELHDTLDTLLTVATLPGHPFNALFLDQRLHRYTMPDRDAWWSTYLHDTWRSHGAVDRIVDWASSLNSTISVDDEAVDLCAISLSWMFTTSNRFLRDRATSALMTLLIDRLPAVVRLVERFADIDDPYVAERVYAVAYGTAMRCHDPVEIEALATCVYEQIFAAANPPPHILLRDYARGVVERAVYLGSAVDVVIDSIRPPYKSVWPTIPTQEEIKPLLPDWSRGSHDSGELEWGRNHIGNSVMGDDFARYVIGTNSSPTSRTWLSLRIDEPKWQPPLRFEDLLRTLITEFSGEERKAWEQFESAYQTFEEKSQPFFDNWFNQEEESDQADFAGIDITIEIEKSYSPELIILDQRWKDALDVLNGTLTEEHSQRLKDIWTTKADERETTRPPRFELHQIQRYILWRVFDLGWTVERFGHFDRYSIGYKGRSASKAERIGKKYQWIAYHEIMAYLSDQFQYKEEFQDNDDQKYEGPWQHYLRDIDPSCTMKSLPGGTSWDGDSVTWWEPLQYNNWKSPSSVDGWILNTDDLPKIEQLLVVTNPLDSSCWLNGQAFFKWKKQPPADRESIDVEHRELWYIATGYLIQEGDAQLFLKWAENVDFWGRWMPEAPSIYKMFLGEHLWAPAAQYFHKEYYGEDSWTQPSKDCPVKVRTVTLEYLRESSGFDCAIDESYTLQLPVSEIVEGLGIRWSGIGADFVDALGQVAVQDPTVYADGPSALLMRADLLQEFLNREKLTLCWAVLGEKRVLPPGFGNGPHHPALRMTGAYILSEGKLIGFMKHILDDPNNSDRLSDIKITRTN